MTDTPAAPLTAQLIAAPPRRQAPPPGPCAMVIFGASGDLTRRLLVPALYNLARTGLIPEHFAIIGVDIAERSADDLRDSLRAMLQSFVGNPSSENRIDAIDETVWQRLTGGLSYVQGDFSDRGLFEKLRLHLHEVAHERQTDGNCLFYLAVADRFFGPIVEQLGHAGLLDVELQDGKPQRWRRVVIEKPFGHSVDSAHELNTRIRRELREEQIFRIDHFLGKETVQNIMAFRFANGLFEPIWNRDRIDHVQITVAETVGVEHRGRFYEVTGALRDMVPHHVFQLLAMIAMEPPAGFDARSVRDRKADVFAALGSLKEEDAVRGQYGPGTEQQAEVPGYRAEPNVAGDSNVETFVAIRLTIDNWRWAGVPFYLRTGKRMSRRYSEIAIRFKHAPYAPFEDTHVEELPPNWMVLRIQPDEGVALRFGAKVPGQAFNVRDVLMDMSYGSAFLEEAPDAYERLLLDAMVGDPTLFIRSDEVDQAWQIVDPLLEAWASKSIPLAGYAAGTWGPRQADQLIERDGRQWRTP